MMIIIPVVVFVYVLVGSGVDSVLSHCFHGMSSSCQFTCHCRSNAPCVQERGPTSGVCPDGCAEQTYGGGPWGRKGCQYGNIAFNSSHACFDGFDSTCMEFETGMLMVNFDRVYSIDHLLLYISHNSSNSGLYIDIGMKNFTNPALPNCGKITDIVRGGINKLECQQPMIGDRVVIFHTDHIPLSLCEVRVKGYQYVQCAGYDGNFYYGPACGLPCNCATQCNYTTGSCGSRCNVGYSWNSRNVCSACVDGTFGKGCNHTCNCMDATEACDNVDGRCISGCAKGYATVGCNYELPSLALMQTPTITKWEGMGITLALKTIWNEDISYALKVQVVNLTTFQLVPATKVARNGNSTIIVEFEYTAKYSDVYQLCVVPISTLANLNGEQSPCLYVKTMQSQNTNMTVVFAPFMIWLLVLLVLFFVAWYYKATHSPLLSYDDTTLSEELLVLPEIHLSSATTLPIRTPCNNFFNGSAPAGGATAQPEPATSSLRNPTPTTHRGDMPRVNTPTPCDAEVSDSSNAAHAVDDTVPMNRICHRARSDTAISYYTGTVSDSNTETQSRYLCTITSSNAHHYDVCMPVTNESESSTDSGQYV